MRQKWTENITNLDLDLYGKRNSLDIPSHINWLITIEIQNILYFFLIFLSGRPDLSHPMFSVVFKSNFWVEYLFLIRKLPFRISRITNHWPFPFRYWTILHLKWFYFVGIKLSVSRSFVCFALRFMIKLFILYF